MRTLLAVAQARYDTITEARLDTCEVLREHDLYLSALALTLNTAVAFNDFFNMRQLMRAGGLHCVRIHGGRGIDRR